MIICLLGSVAQPGRLYASDTLYLDRNFEQAYARDHAWIYEDKEQDVVLQTVLNRTFLDRFRILPGKAA